MMQCKFCIGSGWRSLLRHVLEVHEIDEGYAFKFRLSNHLIRRISDYTDFEKQHGSSLIFTLHVKPHDGEMWFRVCGSVGEKERIRTVYVPLQVNQVFCNGHSGSKPPSQFY